MLEFIGWYSLKDLLYYIFHKRDDRKNESDSSRPCAFDSRPCMLMEFPPGLYFNAVIYHILSPSVGDHLTRLSSNMSLLLPVTSTPFQAVQDARIAFAEYETSGQRSCIRRSFGKESHQGLTPIFRFLAQCGES